MPRPSAASAAGGNTMSLLLACDSISKSFGPRALFNNISISFDDEEKTGLIGPNGSGKSTLLKILAGIEKPDTGNLTTRRKLRLGYLAQADLFKAGQTVVDVVLGAMTDDHSDEHERLTKTQILLDKVGFTDLDQSVDALSGGWRKRLSLARELIQSPDLLLLDEPTNHLDLEGILWLEKLLSSASFSFVLCTHDRYFLENVTNRVVELSQAYADGYLSVIGTYSDFLQKREEYLEAQSAQQQAVASRVRREIAWLQRGAKARTTKAKGRIQQAGEMMEDLAALKARNAQAQSVEIDFSAMQRQTRKLLTVKDVAKSLGGKNLFTHLNLVLSPGMKLGLLGRNGSGKSTLIRLLTGELEADTGQIWRADGLRIVHFDQKRAQVDQNVTVRRALAPAGDNFVYRGASMHVSAWARKFLFRLDQLDMHIRDLSGGEQARILLADLVARPADLLILDEPTNDLDIPSLEVLEESLQDFPGALVLVTHDRFMLDRISTELLALDGNGAARRFVDFAQWENAREEQQQAAAAAARASAARPAAKQASSQPANKKLSWSEQRELEKMEETILAAEETLHAAQKVMEDPAILKDHVKLREACEAVDVAQTRVAVLYARWEELEERKG
jgi:ATP-binding cassette subfamily F protein uup